MPRSFFRTAASLLCFIPTVAFAQRYPDRAERWLDNCQNNSSSDGEHFCELRDVTIPTRSTLTVDGRENGGVAFTGEARRDVRVVAMIDAHGSSDADARNIAKNIRILTDGDRVRAEGPSQAHRQWWSVSFDVYVPRNSNLDAITTNGGIKAGNVEGSMHFRAVNGGIALEDVGGDIDARTVNGGVKATLTGTTWIGRGLDLTTTNGGVKLEIPRNYNAQLETGTLNGGMSIDFPVTVQANFSKHISAKLGNGGPPVRVTTTNGGVKISEQ